MVALIIPLLSLSPVKFLLGAESISLKVAWNHQSSKRILYSSMSMASHVICSNQPCFLVSYPPILQNLYLTFSSDINGEFVSAGTDSCLVVTKDGKAYSWGFSDNYQTGQGDVDDVKEATLIDNTAVRGKKLCWAGAGGQFSVLCAEAEDTPMAEA